MLYPTISDLYNRVHQSQVVHTYHDDVGEMKDEEYLKMLSDAYEYNQYLLEKESRFQISKDEHLWYEQLLNVRNGMMGNLIIDKIHVYLPIYHGDSEEVLQSALGHVEGSSLPVGGKNTHCVLMGHRGLPSARLFTDLDQLEIGDIFKIHILDETLTYEVDQIKVVEPDNLDDIRIEKEQDYVTLVTCTPYGINTHRLLVRGKRIR